MEKDGWLYGPCDAAAMPGGLYTLNRCESVVVAPVAGGGGDDPGSGTAAAAVDVAVAVAVAVNDGSVLEDASGAFGAVDARVGGDDLVAGLLLPGVDIGSRSQAQAQAQAQVRHLCGTPTRIYSGRTPQGRAAHLSELVSLHSPLHTYL